jgi:hypothetical protein
MTNLSADQEEGFLRGSSSSFKPRSFHRLAAQPSTPSSSLETRQSKSNYTHHHQQQQQQQAAAADAKEEFSTAIAWPIVLAIIPTLGAFIAGSAEVWSDFIMILLILYYVYKWITGKSH